MIASCSFTCPVLLIGSIQMCDIGVLVLDECHHAAANHAYAVVLEAFYHAQPPGLKPKVLGLTASPSDATALQELMSASLVAPSDM